MSNVTRPSLDEFTRSYCADASRAVVSLPASELGRLIGLVEAAYRKDRQVFVIGNGGSATTASHIACDLSKNIYPAGSSGRLHPFRVTSLTDNVGLLTALANDCGYDRVFAEQIGYFVRRDDLVLAVSASGNSPNIVEAIRLARGAGAHTAALLGFGGGRLKDMVDAPVVVESNDYGHVESAHMVVNHLLTRWMQRLLATPS